MTPSTTTELEEMGPYPVGVRTYDWEDTSRQTPPNDSPPCSYPGATSRKLTTEIWFPAQMANLNEIDSSGAPYPVVIHSHGLGGSRLDLRYLATHLASRGYVVAAPDYPLSGREPAGLINVTRADLSNQPGDWSFILDKVLAEYGANVDPARVGASGNSLGALTTLLVTYHRDLRDPRIGAALAMASPGGCMFTRTFFQTTSTPLLLLHGRSDFLVPLRVNGKRAYTLAQPPKQLVTLRDGSHLGFTEFATDPQSEHFDVFACGGLSLFACNPHYDPANPFPGVGGGVEVGIDPSTLRCTAPCDPGPTPKDAALSAETHHKLTKVVAAAFFEGEFRDDAAARCYLRRSLRRENPDARVRTHSGAR